MLDVNKDVCRLPFFKLTSDLTIVKIICTDAVNVKWDLSGRTSLVVAADANRMRWLYVPGSPWACVAAGILYSLWLTVRKVNSLLLMYVKRSRHFY